MSLDFRELTEILPEDMVKTYNELYSTYKWNNQAIILLWVAFKQALNWNPTHLLDFDNFLHQSSSFNKKLSSVSTSVKGNVDWVISFLSEEDVLKYIEDEDDELSKTILIRSLCRWQWFVNIWWYNKPKSFMYFVDDISRKLWISVKEFMHRFPNLWMLINDIIPNWKINFLKWLDYVINTLFIMWNPENKMDNLKTLNSSLFWIVRDIYKREEVLKLKKEILSLMLISVWIYVGSKIFQTWDVLTDEETETLKKELSKRFWDDLPQEFLDKINSSEDIYIEDIIILVEDLIFAEVVKFFGHIDTSFSESLSKNSPNKDSLQIKARAFYKINNLLKVRGIELDRGLLDIGPEMFRAKMNSYLQQYFEECWIVV